MSCAAMPRALSVRPRRYPLPPPCSLTKSDPISQSFIGPLVEFYKDSANLLAKCNKPDRKGMCGHVAVRGLVGGTDPPSYPEFLRVLYATGVGFAVMGAIGFAVKLIHIPINHLLVG